MRPEKRYRKFKPQQQKIEELEKSNSRFKRIFSEYENINDELWNTDSAKENTFPDDFYNALQLQSDYLEDEISDWLQSEPESKD